MRGLLFLLTLFLATRPAHAACPDMRAMAPFAQAIIERRAPEPFRDLSLEDARCAQERLVAYLAQPWGDAVGLSATAGQVAGAGFQQHLYGKSVEGRSES